MSFSIKKFHRLATPNISTLENQPSSIPISLDGDLTSEDYTLFNLKDKTISNKTGQTPTKPKKGGNSIRSVNGAQADFY